MCLYQLHQLKKVYFCQTHFSVIMNNELWTEGGAFEPISRLLAQVWCPAFLRSVCWKSGYWGLRTLCTEAGGSIGASSMAFVFVLASASLFCSSYAKNSTAVHFQNLVFHLLTATNRQFFQDTKHFLC